MIDTKPSRKLSESRSVKAAGTVLDTTINVAVWVVAGTFTSVRMIAMPIAMWGYDIADYYQWGKKNDPDKE